MNIVVLDSITLNEVQLNRLNSLGQLTSYNESAQTDLEIIERCQNADIILTGWTNFSEELLRELQNVKLISLWSTGHDQIDLEVARACGIAVTNVRGYAQNAVAELAFGLMLDVLRKISLADRAVRFDDAYDWHPFGGKELTDKTIGIIGFGAIGQKVAKIAHGFDMRVLAHSPNIDVSLTDQLKVSSVSLDYLLNESDVVTLHLPLLPETTELISKEALKQMKSTSILINTSRGGLVDQEALCNALDNQELAGAGLDDILIERESMKRLKRLSSVVMTPHIGFNTAEAIVLKSDSCIENVERYLKGRPINVLT